MTDSTDKHRARNRKYYHLHKQEISAKRRAKKIAKIVEEWNKLNERK